MTSLRITTAPGTPPTHGARLRASVDFPVPEKPPLRVVINGQTGKIHGKVPLAAWKIVLTVLLVLGAIAAVVLIGAQT